MGEPIKVGDGFGSYNNTKKDIVNMYANRSGFSITASQSYVDNMNVNKGMRVYAQCQRYGNNAKIYADWNDGNQETCQHIEQSIALNDRFKEACSCLDAHRGQEQYQSDFAEHHID